MAIPRRLLPSRYIAATTRDSMAEPLTRDEISVQYTLSRICTRHVCTRERSSIYADGVQDVKSAIATERAKVASVPTAIETLQGI